jgi:hypothetical protein
MEMQLEITNKTTEIVSAVSSEWFPIAFLLIQNCRQLRVTHATVNGSAFVTRCFPQFIAPRPSKQ